MKSMLCTSLLLVVAAAFVVLTFNVPHLFAQAGDHNATGTIIAVDPEAESITIETDTGTSQTFAPVRSSYLMIDGRPGQFAEIQTGMTASVAYYQHADTIEVAWVDIQSN